MLCIDEKLPKIFENSNINSIINTRDRKIFKTTNSYSEISVWSKDSSKYLTINLITQSQDEADYLIKEILSDAKFIK